MKTAEIKILDLCNEIDYWKDRCSEAEKDAKYWKDEYAKHLNESIAASQRGVANALLFALYASDDENGNLVINSSDRKILAERYTE
jgi:hypothetical protein